MGTHFRKLHNAKEFLAWWDLPDDRDVTVTITRVTQGELRAVGGRGKTDRKPVLHLRGTDKRLIANITNCKTIAALYGDEIEGWIGKRVTLYRSVTATQDGGTSKCIRIRNVAPPGSAQTDAAPELVPDVDGDEAQGEPSDGDVVAHEVGS